MWPIAGVIGVLIGAAAGELFRRRRGKSRGREKVSEDETVDSPESITGQENTSANVPLPETPNECTSSWEQQDYDTPVSSPRPNRLNECICGCHAYADGSYRWVVANHIPSVTVDQILRQMQHCSSPKLFDVRMDYSSKLFDNEHKRLCVCGCEGRPRGKHSRYCPGHDARHRSHLLELLEQYC